MTSEVFFTNRDLLRKGNRQKIDGYKNKKLSGTAQDGLNVS
jgi:hypothetical protein